MNHSNNLLRYVQRVAHLLDAASLQFLNSTYADGAKAIETVEVHDEVEGRYYNELHVHFGSRYHAAPRPVNSLTEIEVDRNAVVALNKCDHLAAVLAPLLSYLTRDVPVELFEGQLKANPNKRARSVYNGKPKRSDPRHTILCATVAGITPEPEFGATTIVLDGSRWQYTWTEETTLLRTFLDGKVINKYHCLHDGSLDCTSCNAEGIHMHYFPRRLRQYQKKWQDRDWAKDPAGAREHRVYECQIIAFVERFMEILEENKGKEILDTGSNEDVETLVGIMCETVCRDVDTLMKDLGKVEGDEGILAFLLGWKLGNPHPRYDTCVEDLQRWPEEAPQKPETSAPWETM